MKIALILAFVISAIFFVIQKDEKSLDNLEVISTAKVEKKELKNEKIFENSKITIPQEEKQKNIAVSKTNDVLKTVPPKLEQKIVDNEVEANNDNKIVGYQKVYEYINDKGYEPLYPENKVSSDNSKQYNIYYKKNDESKNEFIPPMAPKFITTVVSGTKLSFVVPGNTKQVAVNTIDSNENALTPMNLDNLEKDKNIQEEKTTVISAPPAIGQNN